MVLQLEWAKPLLGTSSLLLHSRSRLPTNTLNSHNICIVYLCSSITSIVNTLGENHIPSTQLVEKKAMFLVSSGFSLEKSGDLV